MKKLNVYAVGMTLFEGLIIAVRIGGFLSLGLLRGWGGGVFTSHFIASSKLMPFNRKYMALAQLAV
jgi:hypothetical protein